MKSGYVEKDKRKTLLFLADDCRLPSGIGTMTKELIIGTAHIFNYVHVGAGINHPEYGKILDISADVNKEAGITDSSVIVYPYNGYGDPDLVRMLLQRHNVDGIVHFTDPRYWTWLYHMSAELRQEVPIFYYHIWDDLPAPHYNKPYYQSCDLLMGISKQSVNISHLVLGKGNYVELTDKTTAEEISQHLPKTCYVPHGINTKYFKPVDRTDSKLQAFRKELFRGEDVEFAFLSNNRNIRRKMTSDVILAYKLFCDKLPDKGAKTRLVMHTHPIDENGTDLFAVIDALTPEYKDQIVFTGAKYAPEDMNLLYNACDTVINIASNEGWGLSSTEALLTGRTLINNVTGGLQDQCRFVDENGKWIDFTEDFASNHTAKYTECGNWVKALFPNSINLQGSIPTPYIFDDRVDIRDVAKAMMYWYGIPLHLRETWGKEGYDWAIGEAGFTAEVMSNRFADAINKVITNWKPIPKFNLYNIQDELKKLTTFKNGIEI